MGGTSRWVGIILVFALVLCAVLTVGVASGAETDAQVDPDSILLRVALDDDGSAHWQIRHTVSLDDENATQAFDSLRADIQENRSAYEQRFANRISSTVSAAENETGREMGISNVTVSTTYEVSGSQGAVTYEFEWHGFAFVDGDRFEVGDAIAGMVLDRRTTLQIEWPEGYVATTVDPAAHERRGGVATWSGPVTFAADEPLLVLSSVATPTPDGGDGPPGSTQSTPRTAGDVSPLLVLGALVGIGLLLVLAWFARRRGHLPGAPTAAGSDEDPRGGASDVRTGADESSESEESPPPDLLSNEERVLQLLEENGGRMKQQDVVTALEWTDAKTSQVVGNLRDDEEIEVFRIGRENVLALPGEREL